VDGDGESEANGTKQELSRNWSETYANEMFVCIRSDSARVCLLFGPRQGSTADLWSSFISSKVSEQCEDNKEAERTIEREIKIESLGPEWPASA
jgi:hypothetical protein